MSTKIFVNPPVKNLNKSMDFFRALGWTFNQQFADETAASLVISEDIYAMLLTHEKFAGFTNKKIADGTAAEALIAIAVDSKAEVDRIAEAALKAGAQEAKPPQDAASSTSTVTTGKSSTWIPPMCSPRHDLDRNLFVKAQLGMSIFVPFSLVQV